MRKKHPKCPLCGEKAAFERTPHGPRHDCCGLWSWGFKPLVGIEVHRARRAAHVAFDTLWRGRGRILTRSTAYYHLASKLGLTRDQCHMARMDLETARAVPGAVSRIKKMIGF